MKTFRIGGSLYAVTRIDRRRRAYRVLRIAYGRTTPIEPDCHSLYACYRAILLDLVDRSRPGRKAVKP